MTSKNGSLSLSAIDFLGLAESKKVARINLADVDYEGVIYVCDLTTSQQQKIMSGPRKGKTVVRKDGAYELDWADLPVDAASKMLESCMVTDVEDGHLLEAAFEAANADGESSVKYVTFPLTQLVFMVEEWTKTLKQQRLVREKLDAIPNTVTNLIVRTVRELSGLSEDRVDEKKENY